MRFSASSVLIQGYTKENPTYHEKGNGSWLLPQSFCAHSNKLKWAASHTVIHPLQLNSSFSEVACWKSGITKSKLQLAISTPPELKTKDFPFVVGSQPKCPRLRAAFNCATHCVREVPPTPVFEPPPPHTCILEFDGVSKGNPGQAGAGAVLRTDYGNLICRLREGLGIATVDVVEVSELLLNVRLTASEKHHRHQCLNHPTSQPQTQPFGVRLHPSKEEKS